MQPKDRLLKQRWRADEVKWGNGGLAMYSVFEEQRITEYVGIRVQREAEEGGNDIMFDV